MKDNNKNTELQFTNVKPTCAECHNNITQEKASTEQERDEYINDLFYTYTKMYMLVVESTTLKIVITQALNNTYNVNKQHQSSVDHVLRLLDELKQPLDQIAKQLKAKYI